MDRNEYEKQNEKMNSNKERTNENWLKWGKTENNKNKNDDKRLLREWMKVFYKKIS